MSHRIPICQLARELNRLYHRFNRVPKHKDILIYGKYSKSTYTRRFCSYLDALKASNVPIKEYKEELKTTSRKTTNSDLARDLNRLSHQVTGIPTWRDIEAESNHARETFENRFGELEEAFRASNVIPPIEHVVHAVEEYIESGKRYATSNKLRSSMFYRGDMSDTSKHFGMDGNTERDKEREIEKEWDYPRMSLDVISNCLKQIEKEGGYDVEVEEWSNSQRIRWKFHQPRGCE